MTVACPTARKISNKFNRIRLKSGGLCHFCPQATAPFEGRLLARFFTVCRMQPNFGAIARTAGQGDPCRP